MFLAERIRRAINEGSCDSARGLPKVSVSIGVTEFNGETDTVERALARADDALYAAKRDGRNLTRRLFSRQKLRAHDRSA